MKTAYRILVLSTLLGGHAAADEALRILPLGDSITHGWYGGITTELNSYRKNLKILLNEAGYATDFVGSLTNGAFADNQHEGHDSCRADDPTYSNILVGRTAGWMADTEAEIVLLHIGTNDLNADDTNTHAEVSTVLDEIFMANSNATVVLALIINIQSGQNEFLSARVSTYNSNLNIMAQARINEGEDIIVVDMESCLDYSSADMNDWLHPSQLGYDKMATNWYPAVIQAILRQQGPEIEGISSTNNQIVLSIGNLATNRSADLLWTPDLDPPAWSNLATIVPQSLTTNLIFQASETSAFFRVATP